MKTKTVGYSLIMKYDPVSLRGIEGRLIIKVWIDEEDEFVPKVKLVFYKDYSYVPGGEMPSFLRKVLNNIHRHASIIDMTKGSENFKTWCTYSYQEIIDGRNHHGLDGATTQAP